MKWFLYIILFALCITAAGCASPHSAGNPTPTEIPAIESIEKWPENSFTRSIPKPEHGTPDYVIDGKGSYYAVFLKDITMQQGKQYAAALKADGFESVAGDENSVSIGQLWQKDEIYVGLSISEHVLGIYLASDGEILDENGSLLP